jgi:hypothetical protein
VEWEVVDAAVGTVDRNGVFTVGQVEGHYPGSVMGTGLMDGDLAGESITAVLDVVIQPPPAGPQGIAGEAQILPRGIRMSGSQGIRLSALMFNDRGVSVTVVDPIWDYDPVLFSISSRGRMTALAPPGVYPDAVSTTVTGPDGLPQTVSAAVTVLGPMVRVDVTPGRATLAAADGVLFVAQAFDVANNRLLDVRRPNASRIDRVRFPEDSATDSVSRALLAGGGLVRLQKRWCIGWGFSRNTTDGHHAWREVMRVLC